MKLTTKLAGIALALATCGANAGVMSYDTATYTSNTALVASNTSLGTLDIAQYNLAYTLLSVTLHLRIVGTEYITVTNQSGADYVVDPFGEFAGAQSSGRIAGTGALAGRTSLVVKQEAIQYIDTFAAPTANGDVSWGDNGGATIADTETVSSVIFNINATGAQTWTAGDVLAAFTGAGTVSVSALGSGLAPSALPTNIAVSTVSSMYDQVWATYTYTVPDVVPEPASLALFGIAALGLVAARKRA